MQHPASNLFSLPPFQLQGVRHSLEVPVSPKPKRFSLARSPSNEEQVLIEDEFPYDVFGSMLEFLDLSNNKLCAIPISLCQLTSLEELNIS